MKKLLLFILSGLFLININAQTTVNFEWVRKTGGTGSDQGRSVAVDASGNVYTAGSFQGTVDFDPGAGTYTLVSLGSDDAYVTKFDALGNFIWAKTFGGTLQDIAYDIDLDQNGNIYTTGHFENTVDFDPSASTYTITSLGLQDVFINKLDPLGNFIWTKVLGGTNSNVPYSIDVDATGNVHTTGYFSGNIDLDPSASTYTINGLGGFDIFISKLDAFGNFLWGKSIAGTSNEIAYAITTDASGNVYTTGYYAGTVDFDPNAGSSPKTSSGNQPDVFISKLDASGNYVNAIGLVGNWTTNQANSIKVNNTGEVYIGGAFDATIDFDPGAGTINLGTTGVGDIDAFIAKYDASLNYIWAKRIGSTFDESCLGIDLDASDNIYATGYFRGTVDFDPNAGAFNMSTAGSNATYFLKLDPLGNFIWARNIAAASGNSGNGIVVNSLNDVYTVGGFAGNVDFDPNTGTYTLTAVGSNDTYVHKMSQCIAYASPVNTTPISNLTICQNQTTTLTASGTGTVNWFATSTSTAVLGTGLSFVTPTLSAGSFTYYASTTNTCGLASIRTPFTLTVNAIPSITVNSGSICAGSSFTINPSGANTYTFSNGSVVTPTSNTSYTVTGTGANGCVNSIGSVSSVTVNALPVIVVNSGSICAGNSFTITPSGASTYTIEGGGAVKTPTATTTYTVIGRSAAGCTSSTFATSSITVNARPIITVNSGSICIGNSFTITPSGANTYTFQGGSAVKTPTANASYTVTGTSTAGCPSSTFAVSSVTVNSRPVISVNSGSICAGNSFTINPGGASTYTIQGGSAVVNPTATASYTVVGTNTAGCISNTFATSNVTVSSLPIISVNSGSICSGNSFTITPSGASTYTIEGGSSIKTPTASTSYTVIGTSAAGCVSGAFATSSITVNTRPIITVNSGSICSGNSFTINPAGANTYTIQGGSAVVSPTATTNYTVVGTSAAGCVSNTFATSNVTVSTTPTITVNSGSICSGNSFTINPAGANTYTIQGGNAVVSPTATASYTVVGTSAAGCISNTFATSNVTVNALPTISLSGGAICPGNSFTLSPGGANTYTYSSGSAVVSPTITTSYSVSGTSAAGCISSSPAIATVTVANTLTVSITGANTICEGQSANLTAGGATSYTWNTGATSSIIAPAPTTNTTYSVIGASGSCSNTAVITITVNPLPTINTATTHTLLCAGETASLTASGSSISYTWNPGGTGASIAVTPALTTNYSVTGTDANGCENTSVITQSVSACTGIDQIAGNGHTITLFPNPASVNVTVKTDDAIQIISIYTPLGKMVQTETENSFSVEQLASGIYLVKVQTAKRTVTIRFIKE